MHIDNGEEKRERTSKCWEEGKNEIKKRRGKITVALSSQSNYPVTNRMNSYRDFGGVCVCV